MRVGVVVDVGLRGNPRANQFLESLREVLPNVSVYENQVSEPDYDYLERFRTGFNGEIDVIIGMGGGSTLDLAKAVSVLVTNPGPAIKYRGFNLIKRSGVPMIAIPTTAGTGSEVTPYAVFTDQAERRKFGINSPLFIPRLAVLDPLMTVSCPDSVTASSGMDALVHAVEGFVARRSNPVSQLYSREAFRILMGNLPVVLTRPNDLDTRLALQIAALYAGIGLMNSGAGLTGALSYPLGVNFRVPHGLAGGFFLARISRWNVERGVLEYGDLYDLLPDAGSEAAAEARALRVCDALERLSAALQVPRKLRHFGVTPEDVPTLVEQTFLLAPAIDQNRAPVMAGDVRALLSEML